LRLEALEKGKVNQTSYLVYQLLRCATIGGKIRITMNR
jgi:hypothetical protein